MLKYYEEALYGLRAGLDLQDESIIFTVSDKQLIEDLIHAPAEIWRHQNELQEEVFAYIKHFKQGSVVILCTVLNSEPAFIFLMTKTSSQKLISAFRIGERMAVESNQDMTDVADIIWDLESKKSYLLADLLSKRNDVVDIPFEEFSSYDYCLEETLESPDEVFEFKDQEGDLLKTSIKSFGQNNKNIFYIILTFNNMNILSFPTEDMDLYAAYRIGKQLSSSFKN
jgi:hypothetical protein